MVALGALGSGLAGAGAVWGWHARTKARSVKDLADWLAESVEARELGYAYLDRYPSEASIDMLTDALSATVQLMPFRVSASGVQRAVRTRTRQDFEQGRIVTLDGWLFSQTELRLCALAALRSDGGGTVPTIGILAHRSVNLDEVSVPRLAGSDSMAPGAVVFEEGLSISLGREYRPRRIELTLDANDTYVVLFLSNGVEVAREDIGPHSEENGRFALYRRQAPSQGRGIDAIRLFHRRGRYPYSLGHLHLYE